MAGITWEYFGSHLIYGTSALLGGHLVDLGPRNDAATVFPINVLCRPCGGVDLGEMNSDRSGGLCSAIELSKWLAPTYSGHRFPGSTEGRRCLPCPGAAGVEQGQT